MHLLNETCVALKNNKKYSFMEKEKEFKEANALE